MADRKSFLLRLPPALMDELNRWAKDELRSLNAQIEYILREAIRRRGRRQDKNETDEDNGKP
ncbi:MAG: Arc family DNA-binding protein [Phycisphaerae bacterium]